MNLKEVALNGISYFLCTAFIIHKPNEVKFGPASQPLPTAYPAGEGKLYFPANISLTALVNGRLLKVDDGVAMYEDKLPQGARVVFQEKRTILQEEGESVKLGATGVSVVFTNRTRDQVLSEKRSVLKPLNPAAFGERKRLHYDWKHRK